VSKGAGNRQPKTRFVKRVLVLSCTKTTPISLSKRVDKCVNNVIHSVIHCQPGVTAVSCPKSYPQLIHSRGKLVPTNSKTVAHSPRPSPVTAVRTIPLLYCILGSQSTAGPKTRQKVCYYFGLTFWQKYCIIQF
jgi:hypothetical protein